MHYVFFRYIQILGRGADYVEGPFDLSSNTGKTLRRGRFVSNDQPEKNPFQY